jgi:hypothetical protein
MKKQEPHKPWCPVIGKVKGRRMTACIPLDLAIPD